MVTSSARGVTMYTKKPPSTNACGAVEMQCLGGSDQLVGHLLDPGHERGWRPG